MMNTRDYWSERRQTRFTRRRFLRGAALAGTGLAGAALIGCGAEDDEVAPTPPPVAADDTDDTQVAPVDGEPVEGGRYIYAAARVDGHWSSHHTGGWPGVLDGVYQRNVGNRLRGDDAMPQFWGHSESVEFPQEVPIEAVITYGGSFHSVDPDPWGVNGRDVEAEDVYVGFQLRVHDETSWARSMYLHSTDMEATQVIDDKTLRHVLHEPVGAYFDTQSLSVHPRELSGGHIEGQYDLRNEFPPVGGGWLMHDSHDEGNFVQYKARKDQVFGREFRQYLDEVRIVQLPDLAAMEAAFRAGNIHLFVPNDQPTFDRVVRDMGDRANGVELAQEAITMLGMNGHRPPFNDIRAREAVHRAIDQDLIIERVLFGAGLKPTPGINPIYTDLMLPENDPVVQDYWSHDPQRAAQLVEAIKADGTWDGEPIHYVTDTAVSVHEALAPVVADMLREVGFRISIESVPRAQFEEWLFPPADETGYDASGLRYGLANVSRTGALGWMLSASHSTPAFAAYGGMTLRDPEIDEAITTLDRTLDGTPEQLERAHQLQRLLLDRWYPQVGLFSRFLYRVWDSRLHIPMPHWTNLHQPGMWFSDGGAGNR